MTRRERLERKIERRHEWADGRRTKASGLEAYTDRYRGDVAFNTQPGHIPERARVIGMQDRAFEHREVAAHHEAKAAGLADQLGRSVFSDDADAVPALEARITEREAEAGRIVELNRLIRRELRAGLAPGWLERIGATDAERSKIEGNLRDWRGQLMFPGYVLSNLRGRIAADRDRIKAIHAREERSQRAEAAGGVIVEGEAWVRVTFAEKPARAVLDALRAARFQWHSGSWVGERAKLPLGVAVDGREQAR